MSILSLSLCFSWQCRNVTWKCSQDTENVLLYRFYEIEFILCMWYSDVFYYDNYVWSDQLTIWKIQEGKSVNPVHLQLIWHNLYSAVNWQYYFSLPQFLFDFKHYIIVTRKALLTDIEVKLQFELELKVK